jgi:hypothetical protein
MSGNTDKSSIQEKLWHVKDKIAWYKKTTSIRFVSGICQIPTVQKDDQ